MDPVNPEWGDPGQQGVWWNPLTGEYEDPTEPLPTAAADFFGSHTDPPPAAPSNETSELSEQTDHFASHQPVYTVEQYVPTTEATRQAIHDFEAEERGEKVV